MIENIERNNIVYCVFIYLLLCFLMLVESVFCNNKNKIKREGLFIIKYEINWFKNVIFVILC